MLDEWLECFRWPSCRKQGIKIEGGQATCGSCEWKTEVLPNFISFLYNDAHYDKALAERYNHLFEQLEKGELGDNQYYYGKTAEQEFEEFLEETKLEEKDISGLRILDAGCGIARLTRILVEKGALAIALDIQPRLYVYASKHDEERKSPLYMLASIDDMPLEDCFDVVWCQGVLSYVPDPEKAIRELQRVTKVGGICYAWSIHSTPPSTRIIRSLPGAFRRLALKGMALLVKIINKLRKKDKPSDRLPLVDRTMPDKITLLSMKEMVSNFDDMKWQKIWCSDEKNTVRGLFKKLS